VENGNEESREEEETMQYSEFFKKKWYSEEELREIICYQKIDKDKGLVEGLSINSIKYLLKRLFGDNGRY
jgi:hypothetical protein